MKDTITTVGKTITPMKIRLEKPRIATSAPGPANVANIFVFIDSEVIYINLIIEKAVYLIMQADGHM